MRTSTKEQRVAGREDVLVEQINTLDPKPYRWLMTILNKGFMENTIRTI